MLRAHPWLQAPVRGCGPCGWSGIAIRTREMWDSRVRYRHGAAARGPGAPAPRAARPSSGDSSGQSRSRTAVRLPAGLPGRAGPRAGGSGWAAPTAAGPSPPDPARCSAQHGDGTVPSITRPFNWTIPGMLSACGHRLQVGTRSRGTAALQGLTDPRENAALHQYDAAEIHSSGTALLVIFRTEF